MTCKVENCSRNVIALGMCERHYRRFKKYGDPQETSRPEDWGQRTSHPMYKLWHGMVRRCDSPKHKDYHNYGARGVTVCDRWKDFWLFLEDVGNRPGPEYSLDRIDNSGDYTPENVRWATATQQARNRRTGVLTKAQAREIHRRARRGEKTGDIARSMALSYDHVRNVVVGNCWANP